MEIGRGEEGLGVAEKAARRAGVVEWAKMVGVGRFFTVAGCWNVGNRLGIMAAGGKIDVARRWVIVATMLAVGARRWIVGARQ